MIRNIQRISALAAMIAVLWVLYADSPVEYGWAVWCVLAIAMILEQLSFQTGVVHGIDMYTQMTPDQQKDVKKILDDQ
jgi:hypothetical protein